jgi:hypothetical protein
MRATRWGNKRRPHNDGRVLLALALALLILIIAAVILHTAGVVPIFVG